MRMLIDMLGHANAVIRGEAERELNDLQTFETFPEMVLNYISTEVNKLYVLYAVVILKQYVFKNKLNLRIIRRLLGCEYLNIHFDVVSKNI